MICSISAKNDRIREFEPLIRVKIKKMGLVKTGISALGRIFIVVALAGAFIVGMVSVVYMSLRGEEVQIPEVVGKDFYQSEKELAALGLKVKKIASRYSEEKPNTILEQRPRAGSAAKTGLMVSVIVSQQNPEGTEAPADVRKKNDDEKNIEEIEDLISDEPSKTKKDSKSADKKRGATTRDVIKKKADENKKTGEDKVDPKEADKTDSEKKTTDDKNTKNNSDDKKTDTKKPPVSEKTPVKPPTTAPDTRTRRVP